MPRKPRTRKDMVSYLTGHYRYSTMNSWNHATSYAACVKLDKFVPMDLLPRAYDFLDVDEAFYKGRKIIDEFDQRHKHVWQIGSNGRSSGYLVLYSGGQKPSGYKSSCLDCGGLNFKEATENSTCGYCGGLRENIKETHMQVFSYPGRAVDQNEDFSDWDIESIRDRVGLVWDFDQTVERIKNAFVSFVATHEVVEKEIMVPKRIKVAKERTECQPQKS